jgi:hypothetical protein
MPRPSKPWGCASRARRPASVRRAWRVTSSASRDYTATRR